jgi:iron-sulfur cluster repair protein YtfE (RIC family)
MFTQIGKRAAAGGAADLLLECHERIRTFLALARRIAELGPSSPDSVAEAAARVRRYFTEALPLHAQDEEVSILPRLRGRDPRVDAELEAMAREHREHERPMGELVAACERIARAPERRTDLLPTVGRAVTELERHFAEHLGREEAVIFPAMSRLLDRSAHAAILREIRERRAGAAGQAARVLSVGAGS